MSNDFEQVYANYVEQGMRAARAELNDNSTNENSQESIVAVRKNDDGDIIAVRTNTGRDLDYVQALTAAKSGELAHVDVFHKYGRDILRSEPDGIEENNLDNLPQF